MYTFMNLKHLKYFITAAELGSISKAAEELNTTQPSLSRQIKAFEESLGWELFIRGAKSIELTHEGSVLLTEGKQILTIVDQRMQRVAQQLGCGTLRIGFSPTIAGTLLNTVIPIFREKHPNIRIQLSDTGSSTMRDALLKNELDLIIEEQGDHSKIEWLDLYTLGRSYAVYPDHPLYDNARISPAEINKEQLVLYSRHEYPSFWSTITNYFLEHQINAKVVAELDGLDSMVVALQAELGIGVISNKSELPAHIKKIPAYPVIPPIRTGIGKNPTTPPAPHINEFIELIQQAAVGMCC